MIIFRWIIFLPAAIFISIIIQIIGSFVFDIITGLLVSIKIPKMLCYYFVGTIQHVFTTLIGTLSLYLFAPKWKFKLALFFLLSGFLITSIAISNGYETSQFFYNENANFGKIPTFINNFISTAVSCIVLVYLIRKIEIEEENE